MTQSRRSTDPQLHASDTCKGEEPEGETLGSQWVTLELGNLQDFVDGPSMSFMHPMLCQCLAYFAQTGLQSLQSQQGSH